MNYREEESKCSFWSKLMTDLTCWRKEWLSVRAIWKALGRQIIAAGGLLDEDGKMKGSALVMEFPDRDALDKYLENEPYVIEGVWQKIDIEIMNVVLVNGEKIQK